MSIIIKLLGLPLEASSVDVRLYFLGLQIPDRGVHIVGGDDGTVFIEFASDEDARQAMARGDGTIKNSNVRLLLSSKTEMQTVVEAARQRQQQHLQQHQQTITVTTAPAHNDTTAAPQMMPQQMTQSTFVDPRILSQNYQGILSNLGQTQTTTTTTLPPLLPPTQQHIFQQFPPTTLPTNNGNLNLGLLASMGGLVGSVGSGVSLANPNVVGGVVVTGVGYGGNANSLGGNINALVNDNVNLATNAPGVPMNNQSPESRARMSGMRGGDDKLFANKRCVLAATNIPYRATSQDIIEFLAEFNIHEDCIRRRYNQKGQPTADAKIAFQTPDAAMKAMKMMNKKNLCGRPVFFKPV